MIKYIVYLTLKGSKKVLVTEYKDDSGNLPKEKHSRQDFFTEIIEIAEENEDEDLYFNYHCVKKFSKSIGYALKTLVNTDFKSNSVINKLNKEWKIDSHLKESLEKYSNSFRKSFSGDKFNIDCFEYFFQYNGKVPVPLPWPDTNVNKFYFHKPTEHDDNKVFKFEKLKEPKYHSRLPFVVDDFISLCLLEVCFILSLNYKMRICPSCSKLVITHIGKKLYCDDCIKSNTARRHAQSKYRKSGGDKYKERNRDDVRKCRKRKKDSVGVEASRMA